MSSFPWDVSTHLHTATMVLPPTDPIGFLLAIFDFTLGWLRRIADFLLSTVTPTAAVHVLSSSTQLLLSPFRTLSMWIHGVGHVWRSFPDLPFFRATLISICLMFMAYRAYKYGWATAINEGPTGAVAEIVAALSSENHELRSTINCLTARIKEQGQDGASSPPAPGVYVFNAGTASSMTTSKGPTADSLNTPHPSSANLPDALTNYHGSYLNDATRRRRRSLSADTGTRRLRRKTHTVEAGLYDFAI